MLPKPGARSQGAPGRGVSASTAMLCSWALLLLASRPTAVEGFAVAPRGGLPGTRYSHCEAMGADPTRAASSLSFMGGGGGEDGKRTKAGDQVKTNALSPDNESAELRLPTGYPFPHASRSDIRRHAMNFLRGGSKNGDFQESGSGSSADITTQVPDSIIGPTLSVQGTVEFQELLRIDGHFEGEVVGDGSLIIGPSAEVISNLSGLDEVYVEGILIGDCSCNKMQIRGAGCVTGNLMTGSLGMDPSVVLKGSANVDKLRSRNTAPASKSKDDSDSKGGGGDGAKAKGDSKDKDKDGSSSKKKEGGGGWAPPPMSASTSGAKSATAVHAHSDGGRPEAGVGGQKWGSSINLSGEDMHRPLSPPALRSFRRVGLSRVPSPPHRGSFHP